MADGPLDLNESGLLGLLDSQIRDYGGNVGLDADLWILFAFPVSDVDSIAAAARLLSDARFPFESGESDDDEWKLYYVTATVRPDAIHWLADIRARVAGEIRPASATHNLLASEIMESQMPHRLAQQLADQHVTGAPSAGLIKDPKLVRALLDRLHLQEPLFFSAFLTLLGNNLIDMGVLLQQIINEDIRLENEIVKAGLSRDPFLQKRQDAAGEIRNHLIRFHIINPIDQQKSTSLANPYSAFIDVNCTANMVSARVDGNEVPIPRKQFIDAIQSTRRNLFAGGEFSSFNTQAPWMKEEIAYSFRFIKQKLQGYRDLLPLDGLYILERAIE